MSKGNDFERNMCRYLSLWLTNQERDDVLWRNRVRKTVMSPDGKHQLGDIMAMDPVSIPFIGLFNVELKTGYSKTKKGKKVRNIPWDLLDLIDHTDKKVGNFVILDFWEQTKTDAEISNRMPMLIFSRDYHVPVVCMTSEDIGLLEDYINNFSGRAVLNLVIENENSMEGYSSLNFYRADDFFKWFTPEIVELMYNKEKRQ